MKRLAKQNLRSEDKWRGNESFFTEKVKDLKRQVITCEKLCVKGYNDERKIF